MEEKHAGNDGRTTAASPDAGDDGRRTGHRDSPLWTPATMEPNRGRSATTMGKRIEGVREDGATERGEVGSSLGAQGGSVEPAVWGRRSA